MQCPKCGKQISNTATFCGYCGATITIKKEEFYETIKEESNKDNKTKNKSNSFIMILSCFLIAAVLGIGAFFIAKNYINNEPVSINKSGEVKEIEVQDDETETDVSFIEDAEVGDAEENISQNDIVDETQEKETPKTSTVKTQTFTAEDVRAMSVEEINKNWEQIKNIKL